MSAKYLRVNLEDMIENYGEDRVKAILADFSCEPNKDVENFLKTKAIEFSKQSIARTQLIYYIENDEDPNCPKRLVGYYSLANKFIEIAKTALSNKLKKRIHRFSKDDPENNKFILPVILIGQLGKNYTDGNNKFIEGKVLLGFALESITLVQRYIGGKFVFLECEDKKKVIKFYKDNGFTPYGKRELDRDEVDIDGKYLIQWIYYMGEENKK